MKDKILILSSPKHPLHELLKALDYKFFDMGESDPFEDKFTHYMKYRFVFDFSLPTRENKSRLLKKLSMEKDITLISELTCYYGDEYLARFKKLQGGFAASFYSPKSKFEYFAQNPEVEEAILHLFGQVGLQGEKVHSPGIGFIFPRTIAMVINEAYYALDEGVAQKADIDQAMRFGTNYPLGPFEWGQKIGLNQVVMLLDEIYEVTKEPRYRASPLLRLEAKL